MQEDDDFQEALGRVLDALVTGGFATGWLTDGEKIDVAWNPAFFGGSGGEAAFLGFVEMLGLLCPQGPLTGDDQAMLILLRDTLYESPGGD